MFLNLVRLVWKPVSMFFKFFYFTSHYYNLPCNNAKLIVNCYLIITRQEVEILTQ